jgi:hypothetical protein
MTIFFSILINFILGLNIFMRGQLVATVFIILLASSVIIGFIFYNLFYGTKYQSQVFNINVIDAVRNLIENFKNYMHLSLTYSSLQALREHACTGGSIGAGAWIRNGPNPVDPDFSKQCLANYTKYYFDVYLNLFNTTLPVELSRENSSVCIYDADSGKILAGAYDEGNFFVNCSNVKISVSGQNVKEFEGVQVDDYITKNRYWYLFRNFYEWAMDDVYSPCVCAAIGCSCSSSSGMEPSTSCSAPVEKCAQLALDDLQRRFDDNVKCKMDKMCSNQGIGPVCNGECGCTTWDNTCMAKGHECANPETTNKPCPLSSKVTTSSLATSDSSLIASDGNFNILSTLSKISLAGDGSSQDCTCRIEGRISGGYRYTCEDYKYFVPSEQGPVPMTFRANAYAFWRDPCACCAQCECPGCGCG